MGTLADRIGTPDGSVPDLGAFGPSVPPSFVSLVSGHEPEGGVEGSDWLRTLPRLVRECAERWQLRATGPVRHGMAAVVVPCTSAEHGPAMLKVTWPHPEAEHEHLALRAWAGEGAVRLLAADPSRWAMLLEPAHDDRPLTTVDVDTSCEVVGGLLRRLDRPALPGTTPLSQECERWAERIRHEGPAVLPRRLVDRAAAIFTELGGEAGVDDRLVHTDLHDGNVLAADREPWLAIDPKPMAAVPEFAVACLVWNREEEATSAPSLREHVRRKVEITCAAGDLDVDQAMMWTLARCALNAVWEAERPDAADADFVTWQVSVAKAMDG